MPDNAGPAISMSAPIPAAQYLRMSTESQQYSLENQLEAIRLYAAANGYQVVKTYQDPGKSGLTLKKRKGLRTLLSDVHRSRVPFRALLVLDVSRWGRWQDIDESAHYEWVMRQAGVPVIYCGEPFKNDGSIPAVIMKFLKRLGAADYSRELSWKVFAGQSRIASMGWHVGGPAPYGFQRVMVDQAGQFKAVLEFGQRKAFTVDKVILCPGPAEEIWGVRQIFELFTEKGFTQQEIAEHLNGNGFPGLGGRPWTADRVHRVLVNERYAGVNTWNRRSTKLQTYRVNEKQEWIVTRSRSEPMIDPEQFGLAQERVFLRAHFRIPEDQALKQLEGLLQERGHLKAVMINEAAGVPGASVYWKRFGSLDRAYELIGYSPKYRRHWTYIKRRLAALRDVAVHQIVTTFDATEIPVSHDPGRVLMVGDLKIWVGCARCNERKRAHLIWTLFTGSADSCDLAVILRPNPANDSLRDLYVLPSDRLPRPFRIVEYNGPRLDAFLRRSVDDLKDVLATMPLQRLQ